MRGKEEHSDCISSELDLQKGDFKKVLAVEGRFSGLGG